MNQNIIRCYDPEPKRYKSETFPETSFYTNHTVTPLLNFFMRPACFQHKHFQDLSLWALQAQTVSISNGHAAEAGLKLLNRTEQNLEESLILDACSEHA